GKKTFSYLLGWAAAVRLATEKTFENPHMSMHYTTREVGWRALEYAAYAVHTGGLVLLGAIAQNFYELQSMPPEEALKFLDRVRDEPNSPHHFAPRRPSTGIDKPCYGMEFKDASGTTWTLRQSRTDEIEAKTDERFLDDPELERARQAVKQI